MDRHRKCRRRRARRSSQTSSFNSTRHIITSQLTRTKGSEL